MIKQKPVQQEGFTNHWNEPDTFFKEKTLYLTDPETLETYHGTVVNSQKNQEGDWIFTLHDHMEIQITPHYDIALTRSHHHKLLTAILSNNLNFNDIFVLNVLPSSSITSGMVAGSYKLSKSEMRPTFAGGVYQYIELTHPNSQELESKLFIYFKGEDQNSPIEAIKMEIKGKKGEYIDPKLFNSIYKAIKKDTQKVQGVNATNINHHILIKDENEDTRIRRMYLKQIREALDEIRTELLKSESAQLVELLMKDLVKNGLAKISTEGMDSLNKQRPDLTINLKEISLKYCTHLKIYQTPEAILKQLIEEVNYFSLIGESQSVVISKTMELLKDTYRNLEEIEGKDVIFFIGNTGSGKSTAISYFLGAEMETVTNRVGDKVIHIKEKAHNGKYPIIGQSLGESETLYTKGYPLEDFPHMLGDCPGFHDTRGSDFEICTNLSIDQAMTQAKSIRSIVLIIPIHAFLVDRANSVIELIETVRERFIDSFNPTKIGENSNFFILITKHDQHEAAVDSLKNGTRIQELLNESKKKIEKEGAISDDFELKKIERRKNIWQVLRLMHDQNQIDFIDIEDAFEKDKLLTKYTTAYQQEVKKNRYVNAMQGLDIQTKFGKSIEVSVRTWLDSILTPYLLGLPEKIKQCDEQLIKKKAETESLQQAKRDRNVEIEKMEIIERGLKQSIYELRLLEKDPQAIKKGEMLEEVNAIVVAISKAERSNLESEYIEIERKIESAAKEHVKIENAKKEIEISIINLKREIEISIINLKKEIEIPIISLKKEIEIKQTMVDSMFISWGFFGGRIMSMAGQKEERKIKQLRAQLLMRMASQEEEEKKIKQLRAQLYELECTLNGIQGVKGKIQEWEMSHHQMETLRKIRDSIKQRQQEFDRHTWVSAVRKVLAIQESKLSQQVHARKTEENFNLLNKEFDEIMQTITAITKEKFLAKIQKRKLAMVIKNQEKDIKCLREFCNLALKGSRAQGEMSPMINLCQKFKKLYEDNVFHLEAALKEDLQLT
ncbi:MAG: hypothetical protein QRY71_06290 [Candidatus Rhabdochlamydia sp.]